MHKFIVNVGGEDNIPVLEGHCPNCELGPYSIVMMSEKLIKNTVSKKYFRCLCCHNEFSATVSTMEKGNENERTSGIDDPSTD